MDIRSHGIRPNLPKLAGLAQKLDTWLFSISCSLLSRVIPFKSFFFVEFQARDYLLKKDRRQHAPDEIPPKNGRYYTKTNICS